MNQIVKDLSWEDYLRSGKVTFYHYVSTYSPAAHLHMLEELAEEMDEADRQDALSVVVSTRNFALRLRHQPRLRRRLLSWACAEEQRIHTEKGVSNGPQS